MNKIRIWLASLSYRTGLYVLGVCVMCYIVSFAQMLLPVSVTTKGVLWVIFFGLAKTAQYSALLILGKSGIQTLRNRLKRKSSMDD